MNELHLGQPDCTRRRLRPSSFLVIIIVACAVALAFAQWRFKLSSAEGDDAAQLIVAPESGSRTTQSATTQAQPKEDALGWRLIMAAIYIGILGSGALAVRYRQKLFHVPQAVSSSDGETIVVRQSKRVNAQLTLVVVEVNGTKLLVAASPRAISTTVLEAR